MIDDTKVSWTSLRRWEECHQHHLRVKQGRAIQAYDGRVFLPGQLVDRLVKWWLDAKTQELGAMEEYAPELFRRFTDPKTDEERDDPDRYSTYKWRGNPAEDKAKVLTNVVLAVRNLEPILERYVLPYDWQPAVRFEAPIRIPGLDGQPRVILLIGEFDIVVRLTREPERFAIWDVKMTEDTSYIRKTLGQSTFYNISFGHWWGNTAQPEAFAFLFPLLDHSVQYVKIEDEHRRAMMGRIIAMAQGMWREEWAPKADNAGCNFCDTKHACDKFTLDIVKDAQGKHRVSFEKMAARRREALDAGGSGSSAADQTA